MKEMQFEIPAGFDVEKVETTDGHVVITLKEKERKLPKSWGEFCRMFPMNEKECYITFYSEIISFDPETEISERNDVRDRSILPDRATAEAVLALCQLIQLRNCYNGDWVPDWTDEDKTKFMLVFDENKLICDTCTGFCESPLYFKTQELCDEFLRNFRPLIDKLKPLYGIKEGGEE